jgi:hypothetical protein
MGFGYTSDRKLRPIPGRTSIALSWGLAAMGAAAGGARVVMTAQPKGISGCAPPLPPLRATGVGRRGGEVRCARRAPQRSPGKGMGC